MQHYLSESNVIAENVFSNKGQHLDSLLHDNDYKKAFEEMMYLTTRKARLKGFCNFL
jgi:hypothetical protein